MNQATDTLRLGKLVKEYKRSLWGEILIIGIALIFGLIAVACFVIGLLSPQEMLAPFICGALPTFVSLLLVYALWRVRGSSLSLHENGLVYRIGGKETVTIWDEIASFTEYHGYRVEKKNGEEICFNNNIKDSIEAGETIKEMTLQRKLPEAKTALLGGSTLEFKSSTKVGYAWFIGKEALLGYTLDTHGITAVKQGIRIAWSEVIDFDKFKVVDRQEIKQIFTIADQNNFLEIEYGVLHNGHLLMDLCLEMIADKQNL